MSKLNSGALPSLRVIDIIGVDSVFLQQCDKRTKMKFYAAGVFMVTMTIVTFWSLYFALSLLFNSSFIAALISLFFASVLLNIYVLIINTFSKESSAKRQNNSIFNFSNISRIGFIIFMAFIIAQPIEVFFIQSNLDTQINLYRHEQIQNFTSQSDRLFDNDINNLERQREVLSKSLQFGDSHAQDEIGEINKRLEVLEAQKITGDTEIISTINNSEFFIKRIILADTKYPSVWVICVIVIILFLLPGFLVYSISGQNVYYKLKHSKERDFISINYVNFKENYSKLFLSKFGITTTFYEMYNNPPFNTEPKRKIDYRSQEDFIKKIFHT